MKRNIITLLLTAATCSVNGANPTQPKTNAVPQVKEYTAPQVKAYADPQVKEYTDYLYSTMITADSLDYPREFYERNVALTLDMRRRMPWGQQVSERDFRNFVLPVRVNNEHLDDARQVLIDSLLPRVQGMSMTEAALEINHWLHQKVTYRPSDSRTSSPLATLQTSFGRCGEESTLGVAAMRAMGIPARQVYTPRWAHTDDNHAWVEVWTDGRWHFLGACEPEAVLDLAWFNAPASRGMLMNTTALGGYDGPEEVLARTPLSTQINVTVNYAPVDTAVVTVVDGDNRPVEGAQVSFMLYNYAEFYPIAVKTADSQGQARLTTGLGDLVIWATAPDGKSFGIDKYSVGSGKPLTLKLDKDAGWTGTMDYTLVPPRQGNNAPAVPEGLRQANVRRLAQEDSIRNAYMATFFNAESAAGFVKRHNLPEEATRFLPLAYGNHRTIADFLTQAKDPALVVDFLATLSEKDIRDITPEILTEFYTDAIPAGSDRDFYLRNVMCPRIYNETLTPYRSYFLSQIPESDRIAYSKEPQKWIDWIGRNIAVDNSVKYGKNIIISPEKVYAHRRDIPRLSRDVFAVASLRAFGVPAYFDAVTMTPHYFADGKDTEMQFGDSHAKAEEPIKGTLQLDYGKTGRHDNPGYYYHFTLSQIKDGRPQLLNFSEEATWKTDFADGSDLPAGQTLLVSGQRLADGSVLARASVFSVPGNGRTVQPLVMRQDSTEIQVIGSFNSENRYLDRASGTVKSLLSTTGRGYYVLALLKPHHEPSIHVLNDLSQCAAELQKWPGKIMLITEVDGADAIAADFPALPSNAVIGSDTDGAIARDLATFGTEAPVIVIADTFNRVVFDSEGYTIGIGQKILDILNRLAQ